MRPPEMASASFRLPRWQAHEGESSEMTVTLNAGLRLRSATDATEVVVVKGSGDADLRCGGEPMLPVDSEVGAGLPVPGFDSGTLIGKRYATEDGSLELLCVKAGDGSLSIGEDRLGFKEAKPLPSSD